MTMRPVLLDREISGIKALVENAMANAAQQAEEDSGDGGDTSVRYMECDGIYRDRST